MQSRSIALPARRGLRPRGLALKHGPPAGDVVAQPYCDAAIGRLTAMRAGRVDAGATDKGERTPLRPAQNGETVAATARRAADLGSESGSPARIPHESADPNLHNSRRNEAKNYDTRDAAADIGHGPRAIRPSSGASSPRQHADG